MKKMLWPDSGFWTMIRRPADRCASLARILGWFCLSLAASAVAADFPIVVDGKPGATITTSEGAGELVRLAASELQSYFRQLSQTEVPLARETRGLAIQPGTTRILLGSAGQSHALEEISKAGLIDLRDLRSEGFVLKTITWEKAPTLVIAGADDAGVLYGAYELLEQSGITFRLTGDILPGVRPNLAAPSLDLRREPAFARRGFLHPPYFDNASVFSWPDYERLLNQMARMKCNYLQFWWFAYAPWLKHSYKGEPMRLGDISAKESGYHSWRFGGFGSRTAAEITIGREHFKQHQRLAPLEMQNIETEEQAFEVSRDLLRRIIDHAASRNIKVWLILESASVPPNLARHGEIVSSSPFSYVFGTFLHPQDPVNREIQAERLKAIAETYPKAEGVFLNLAELYPELANEKHRAFFEEQRPKFHELRQLSIPWSAGLANIYGVKPDQVVDSNLAYLDLFSWLLKKRDALAPDLRLGLMTTGRGYVMPLFHRLLATNVPFASLESSGVWTMQGLPMSYFGNMGSRERVIQPRVDDDFDMLAPQYSVKQYAETDRIFRDGVRHGLTGFAGQVERARGTEFNSSYLAYAAWQPDLDPEQFYRHTSEKMFGRAAADEMCAAFRKLEENQSWLGYYEFNGGYGVLLCTSSIREVNASYQYWRQRDPYRGPVMGSWKRLIAQTPVFIARREGSIALLNEALAHLRAASSNVTPTGRYELNYLVNRTEVFRDCLAGLNTYRKGMVAFDEAFRSRPQLDHAAFIDRLQASLQTMRAGHQQLRQATAHFSEIIDHVSDLAVLYHLNVRVVGGLDLSMRFCQNVLNYHRGEPYLDPVPFDRLMPSTPDGGAED